MGIFEIIGPVMVGPSSSHTAGAVRLGNLARLAHGGPIRRAEIGLHGSFAATGEGHGTKLALLAGVMGFAPDDERIPGAFEQAVQNGLDYAFITTDLGDVHPNSVEFRLFPPAEAGSGQTTVHGSSTGGGEVVLWRLDGYEVDLAGLYPTVILVYPDHPGVVAAVSGLISHDGLNIAEMKVHRAARGGEALMTLALDEVPPPALLARLQDLPQMSRVRYLSKLAW